MMDPAESKNGQSKVRFSLIYANTKTKYLKDFINKYFIKIYTNDI